MEGAGCFLDRCDGRDARFCVSTIAAKTMTGKYQNKYRISSTRLQNWDYGWNAPYFVTICTQNRGCYFGDIVKTQNFASPYKMELSEIGIIANECWA